VLFAILEPINDPGKEDKIPNPPSALNRDDNKHCTSLPDTVTIKPRVKHHRRAMQDGGVETKCFFRIELR
jgi:hypothetical protein